MDTDLNSLREALLQHLRDTQLDGLVGKVLYSGVSTLKKGPVYFLGFNPGGDPSKEAATVAEHVTQSPPGWNEYLDAQWVRNGYLLSPGQAILQRRVDWLFGQLGLQTREICASNLIFIRSQDAESLGKWRPYADRCWPVHNWILKLVEPHTIICMKGETFAYLCERGRVVGPTEQFKSGHGNWMCGATKLQLGDLPFNLIQVPHLSLYAIDYHPEVVAWVKQMMDK